MRKERGMVKPDGAKVRKLRKLKALTQEDLAGKSGYDRRTIQRIEAGNPTRPFTLAAVAETLGVTLEELLADRPSGRKGARQEAAEVAPAVRARIRSFDTLMADRTQGFLGRGFVFDVLDKFLDDPNVPSGYFLILGEPGIGKTALMAKLIKERSLTVYHFNVALQGINTNRQFLENVCARLIQRFGLGYEALPEGSAEDGAFLGQLLEEASQRLGEDEKLLIAVDALDEVDKSGRLPGHPLYLPPALPDRVFFVLTARQHQDMILYADNIREWVLAHDSSENREDIRRYVAAHASGQGTMTWRKKRRLEKRQFVDLMVARSEGNFMYLRHVLPEIERGRFFDGSPEELPHGLRAYYRLHWAQMRNVEPDLFEQRYQPVVCVLAAALEPVLLEQVAEWTGLTEPQVRGVFGKWREFLHEEGGEGLWRIYHKAFRDFLSDEVDSGLKTYHAMIALSALGRIQPGDEGDGQ